MSFHSLVRAAWARSIARAIPACRAKSRSRSSAASCRSGPTAQDDTLDRLLREAILASALNHPNIVTIYETGVFDTDRYIAMELIEGSTLRQVAQQGLAGRPRARHRAPGVGGAGGGARRADRPPRHQAGQRDGAARRLRQAARLRPGEGAAGDGRPSVSRAATTEAGLLLGTVAYMAPEQARGEMVTQEADVFALGVMLYELVTGRHPFLASSQLGTLHALMWESPEPPSFVNPELPRAIDQLIVEMLQKDPRLRPGASEVMYRLNLAHDSTVAVALSAVTVTQPRRGVGARDRRARSGARRAAARVRAGAARPGPARRHLRRSGDGQDDAGRYASSSSSTSSRSRCASAAAAARSVWPAAKRTCRCSKRSTACRRTSSSAASRA